MSSSILNTPVAGHRGMHNGAIQTGAVALLFGAVLATNGARAAENDVEHDDTIARPAPPARTAQPAPQVAAPATPAAPAPPRPPLAAKRTEAERAAIHDRMDAEHVATRERTAAERAELEAKLSEAQERLNRAASEVAALASERAAEAMERFSQFADRPGRRSVMGVQLSPDGNEGAKVVDVSPGGPAEQAGIRAGDVIVGLNGKDVNADAPSGNSSRQVMRLLGKVEPGGNVKVRVMRDGKPKDFDVVLRPIAQPFVNIEPPPWFDGDAVRGPFGPFSFSFDRNDAMAGLEVTTLTAQLGRYFGTDKGVLVVRAPKSDVYKLQDGDVIVSIDGREPTSGSHITRILGSYRPGEKLTLRVMRDRKAQDIVVTTPERKALTNNVHTSRGREPL